MSDPVFTCITCRVVFADGDLQRAHYKTDWHRYNLKRKVAEMPAVTAENFQQRVLAQREKVVEQTKDTNSQCSLCNKHFRTRNAYTNHLQSKKHKDLEAKETEKRQLDVQKRNEKNAEKGLNVINENEKVLQKDVTNQALKNSFQTSQSTSRSDKDVDQPGSLAHTASSLQSRLQAEVQQEAMEDDDSDAESWESFDGEALGVEECLFCSLISQSMEANLGHMTLKHSFFIPDAEYVSDLDGLVSYLGEKVGNGNICLWCNEKGRCFHTTQAVQRHMVDKGHCKILHEGDAVFEFADFYDYRSSYPDFESEGGGASSLTRGHEEEAMEDEGGKVTEDVHESDGYELVLPSGASVGHRSLRRYYRQNIPPGRENQTRSIMPRLLAQYKALGWTGIRGEAAVQKAKDISSYRRQCDRHRVRLGVKANKFQPHFRCQVMF